MSAFPHTDSTILAHQQALETHRLALVEVGTTAGELTKLVQQQDQLNDSTLRLVENLRAELVAEKAAHAQTQASLREEAAHRCGVEAERDALRKQVTEMRDHPDVKAAEAARREAERQRLRSQLAALEKQDA